MVNLWDLTFTGNLRVMTHIRSGVNCPMPSLFQKYQTEDGKFLRGCTNGLQCTPIGESTAAKKVWCCHGGYFINSYFCNDEQSFPGWEPPDCISNAFCNSGSRFVFSMICLSLGTVMLFCSCLLLIVWTDTKTWHLDWYTGCTYCYAHIYQK